MEDDYVYFEAVTPGTNVIKFYEQNNDTKKVGKYIGSCTVTVKGYMVTDIEIADSMKTYAGARDYISYQIIADEDTYVRVPVTCTSSDESVIKIENNSDGCYTAVNPGTVTVTAGAITKQVEVTA